MFINMLKLQSFTIETIDGARGQVTAAYFENESWYVRYLVVNMGNWLLRNEVLLSPNAIKHINFEAQTVITYLTKEQIENSPEISTQKSISREQEKMLHNYYSWEPYWEVEPVGAVNVGPLGTPNLPHAGPTAVASTNQPAANVPPLKDSGAFFNSTAEIINLPVQATDREVGTVADLIIDTSTWRLTQLVVDTGNWLPGEKISISPVWVADINWENNRLYLNTNHTAVESSPRFDPDTLG